MVVLRELKRKDAEWMLEWMHDNDIQQGFKKNMLEITLAEAENFCKSSKIPDKIVHGDSVHFAVVDESDEYQGTISLKEIDFTNKSAEYAIVLRKKAHGKGIATEATKQLLKKAFNEYRLHRVYLNVFSDNIAAIKLYEKCGFKYEGEFREHICIRGKYKNWKWYGILESEYNEWIINS